MTPDLNELLIFFRIAEAGSITAAARVLELPKSTVSRKLGSLEARIGTRLIQRSTRRLSLTEAGVRYFEHCRRVIAEVEEADEAVAALQDEPRGLLRVTGPVDLGAQLITQVCEVFMTQHPQVSIELLLTDRVVDLVAESFDLAVRAGRLQDSNLIARRLGSQGMLVVASPEYLRSAGTPSSPHELVDHQCIVFTAPTDARTWVLVNEEGERVALRVTGRFRANLMESIRHAAVAGCGVALVPSGLLQDELAEGRLVQLLPGWSTPLGEVHALYPSRRHLAKKTRMFLELLTERWTALMPG